MTKKTRTVQMNARELMDVDVQFISLVDRGANRIPFRVIKHAGEDDTMKKQGIALLDLGGIALWGGKKAEAVVPTAEAVIVLKGDEDQALAGLKARGIETFGTEEKDGNVIIKMVAEPTYTDAEIIKVDEKVAVSVAHLKKYMSSYGDTASFVANIRQNGFWPGVNIATNVFMETLSAIMNGSGAKAEMQAQVEVLLTDFSTYVRGLLADVPEVAFKTAGVVAVVASEAAPAAAAEAPAAEAAPAEGAEVEVAKSDEAPVADAPAADPAAAPAAEVPKEDDEMTKIVKALSEQVAGLATAVAGVVEGLKKSEGVGAAVEEIAGKIKALEGQVVETVKKAEDATKAVNGTVLGGAGDNGDGESFEKSELAAMSKRGVTMPGNMEMA